MQGTLGSYIKKKNQQIILFNFLIGVNLELKLKKKNNPAFTLGLLYSFEECKANLLANLKINVINRSQLISGSNFDKP